MDENTVLAPDSHLEPCPLGYTKEDRELLQTENCDEVAGVFERVRSGDLRKGEAADELGCSVSMLNQSMAAPVWNRDSKSGSELTST